MESSLAAMSASFLDTLRWILSGPGICRSQAPVRLYTPTPSLTLGGCFHQCGFLFPRPGISSAGEDRGAESFENHCIFSVVDDYLPFAV